MSFTNVPRTLCDRRCHPIKLQLVCAEEADRLCPRKLSHSLPKLQEASELYSRLQWIIHMLPLKALTMASPKTPQAMARPGEGEEELTPRASDNPGFEDGEVTPRQKAAKSQMSGVEGK